MSRATETHRFAVEPFRAKPVAQITPSEATGIVGSRVQFSGAGSTVQGSYDNLTLFWSLSARPIDSAAALDLSENSEKAVDLEGDITGTYTVSLYVEADGVRSDTVTASVFFSPAVVPAVKRVDVDGTFMFDVLSDFWNLVNDREIFPIVWSGMTQAIASDFLRAVQIDRAKSIATVQPLFQKKWLSYSPALDLDPSSLDIVYGGSQSGSGAFTGSVTFVAGAVVISAKEVLVSGPTTVRAIGTTMTLFSGTSRGQYLINRINADASGYIVSDEVPFAGREEVASGTTLVVDASSYFEVYDSAAPFAAAKAGDYLQVLVGGNAGYYTISEVMSSTRLRLTTPMPVRASNIKYRLLKSVRASFKSPQTAFTNTVYIPQDEANLPALDTVSLVGTGYVIDNFQMRLESRHVLDSVEGARLRILSGSRAGTAIEIASLNQSLTGIVTSAKIEGTIFPEEILYSIDLKAGFEDRIIVLDGVGHEVATYEFLEGFSPVEEGGRGNLWAVTLKSATAPSGREGIRWRVCPTLRSDTIDDFEKLGVSAGDMLQVTVLRTDLEIGSTFKAQVLGAAGNKIAFELGTSAISFGADGNGNYHKGQIDATDLERMSRELAIPTVTLSESGEALYTESALDIYEIFYSSEFRDAYQNLPLDPTTSISLPSFFQIQVRPTRIIRNTRIPLDPDGTMEESVYSIPALFEYISPERVESQDGQAILVHKDDTTSALTRPPVKLSENNDFSITGTEHRGTALTTRARSPVVGIADYSLVFHGVRPGDELEILTGLSQGTYAITSVTSERELRVSPRVADGLFPVADQQSIEYVIRRRGQGRFIEFSSRFTPSSPAPETLWAPLTLIDNFKYIEDNFGVLVNITKADLDAYGTTQISYRAAVAGLMYAWASGPTLRSAEIGAHILLDLPVTEKPSEIVQIDPEYTDLYGRVITEEIDTEGFGTGIFSIFRYPRSDLYSLEKFKGLGINPLTGSVFAVGDFLPPFTPLTNAVILTDNVVSPTWWREYSAVPGEVELRKYHTWQAEIDVRAVDSRDIPLATEFLNRIRPIYTKPQIVAVLSLLDSVTVDARLTLEMDLHLMDDPAFSTESTRAFDDFNGSGQVLRRFDFGSRSTRTLFQGDDLEFEAGSDTVTSARGGFSGDVTSLPRINSAFPGEVTVFGRNLIQAGDRLVIISGPNRGMYIVAEVVSDTELRIDEDADSTPYTKPISSLGEDSAAQFQVLRDDSYIIYEGSSFAVDSTFGDDAEFFENHVLRDDNAAFRSSGVTADDRVIILSGPNRGVYVIQDLGVFDWALYATSNTGTPDLFADQETALTLATPLPDPDESAEYRIERWSLTTNPVYVGAASGTAGDAYVEIADADLMNIGREDTLYDTSSDAAYKIIAVYGDNVFLDRELEDNVTAVEIRKQVYEEFDGDTDPRLERLMGYDDIEIDIYRPLTVVDAAGPVTLSGSTLTGSFAASAGDLLVVAPSAGSLSHGVYTIAEVDGGTITIDGIFPVDEAAIVSTYTPAVGFDIDGTAVVTISDASHDIEELGVRPGDFFEFDYGTDHFLFPIIEVNSATQFTIAETTPEPASVIGRIFRKETPSQGKR